MLIEGYRALFVQVALGLQVLHELGIVHRDLKPGNILLVENKVAEWARACGGLQIKLCDFGTARQLGGSTMLQTKSMAGTLPFLPPEALKDVDGSSQLGLSIYSDIFSFGTS